MTLIIPQSGNKKFRKTSNRRLSMKKNALHKISLEDPDEPLDVINQLYNCLDGKTPIYLMWEPEDTTFFYADIKPFTLEQARKKAINTYEEEEEEG